MLQEVKAAGYARVRIDSTVYSIEEGLSLSLDRQKKHSVEIVIDRYFIDEKPDKPRLMDSLETAARYGKGIVVIADPQAKQEWLFSQEFSCVSCGINLPPVEPRDFSFNSPHGACSDCTGLGTKQEIDADLLIPNATLSLSEGAIKPCSK